MKVLNSASHSTTQPFTSNSNSNIIRVLGQNAWALLSVSFCIVMLGMGFRLVDPAATLAWVSFTNSKTNSRHSPLKELPACWRSAAL